MRWYDRRAITLTSTFCNAEPIDNCIRRDKTTKAQLDVRCPNIVQEYNSYMRGVDLFDMLNGYTELIIEAKNGIQEYSFGL